MPSPTPRFTARPVANGFWRVYDADRAEYVGKWYLYGSDALRAADNLRKAS